MRAEQLAGLLADARRAVADLLRTRRRYDADQDVDPDQLLDVIIYVSQHTRRLPQDALGAESLAQLVILRYLRAEIDRRQLSAIKGARKRKITWQRIGEAMGLTSRQGGEQAFLRLLESSEGGPKDEKKARAARAQGVRPDTRDEALRVFVQTLIDHRDQLPEDLVEDLDYLAPELHPGVAHQPVSRVFRSQIPVTLNDLRDLTLPPAVRAAVDQVRRAAGL